MNFWMAVDKATVANGCLFVAPGSHSQTLPHDPHPVQGRVMQADAAASLAALVPVELEPGAAGALTLVASTYSPGECASFTVSAHSQRKVELARAGSG